MPDKFMTIKCFVVSLSGEIALNNIVYVYISTDLKAIFYYFEIQVVRLIIKS